MFYEIDLCSVLHKLANNIFCYFVITLFSSVKTVSIFEEERLPLLNKNILNTTWKRELPFVCPQKRNEICDILLKSEWED